MLAGEVVAVDVNEARAHELEVTARRLGASNVRVVVADGRELPPELDGFDRALVDAPCSGLGVLNRRPDLRWRAEAASRAPARAPASAAASASGREGRSSTRCARSTRTSRRPSWTRPGSRSTSTLADEWPQFRHPRRPGVPADAAARPRDCGLLRRENACSEARVRPRIDVVDDELFERALELAERGRGTTHPNPIVGAVVVAGGRDRRRGLARAEGRAACRGQRTCGRGREGARRDGLRDARAVRAPGRHAALRGRADRGAASRESSRDSSTPTRITPAGSRGSSRRASRSSSRTASSPSAAASRSRSGERGSPRSGRS